MGPFAAAAALLVLSGAAKLRRPDGAVRALRAVRWPANAHLVRLLAVVEIVVGAAGIVVGGRVAAVLVALSYVGFTGFVALAMARGESVRSCGCFGAAGTPPTVYHLAMTTAAAAVAAVAAVAPVPAFTEALAASPLLGLPLVVLTGCCAWFAHAALTLLPALSSRALDAGARR